MGAKQVKSLPADADLARGVADGMCGWTRRYLGDIEASRRSFDA